jgi:repressor LexA
MELTRGQRRVYDLLCELARAGAVPPSLDGLCRMLGLSSRGSLHKHVQALVEAGLVAPMQGRRRGVRLAADGPLEADGLPLLGTIAAGRPIEAVAQPERVQVPDWLAVGRDCYLLRVRGDSMQAAGILDGDYVVIAPQARADNGDVVVALIRGEEVTLKRIEQRPGLVLLHAANPAMAPMVFRPDEVQIQGVLVGQLRSYRRSGP